MKAMPHITRRGRGVGWRPRATRRARSDYYAIPDQRSNFLDKVCFTIEVTTAFCMSSAICTYLGCVVQWNSTERTGIAHVLVYKDGHVVNGPAIRVLGLD